jgi:Phospholipase B
LVPILTDNNEWLIVDYKLFTPGEDPPANTVWLLDQVPGYVQSGDVTAVMLGQGGYMPSYNIAYFPFIFNVSGGPEAVEEYGPWFAYATTPRAEIYARDHHKVVDLQSMQAMMRYNDFKVCWSLGDFCGCVFWWSRVASCRTTLWLVVSAHRHTLVRMAFPPGLISTPPTVCFFNLPLMPLFSRACAVGWFRKACIRLLRLDCGHMVALMRK